MARAVEAVLLRGGPQRQYTPSDVPALREDLALLRDFFLARDGTGVAQGVPPQRVEEACRPLHSLLVLLGTPSELLVQMWETGDASLPAGAAGGCVGAAGGAAAAGGGGAVEAAVDSIWTSEQLALVLMHRPDDIARRWGAATRQGTKPPRGASY